MGFANAQRMLDYIRIIVEFISQPDLIPMFGIVHEVVFLSSHIDLWLPRGL
jgi:glucan 1,3-beta-glucosidase